ncbi:MAG: hypothetical protein QCI00_09730, partial [Candidatus Thermoplasmatota archaeon]|nr:hypothetical protein [Candidatus Thermoplasmatota archaeon]
FQKNNNQITINANINSYYQSTSNIRYQIVDIYKNKETIVKNGVIPSISINNYETVSVTLSLTNPEHHQIKIIVDPYNKIEEITKSNNVAIRTVTFGEGYILTTVSYKGKTYNVMFTPTISSSFQNVITQFNNNNPSFVYNIEKLWIVDTKKPYKTISNANNNVGSILYEVADNFNQNPPFYPYDSYYHSVENAEIVANNVRNRWLFDVLSISHWFDELFGDHEKEEVLELWDYVITGPVNRYVPETDPIKNLIGGTFAVLSLASTAKNNWKMSFEELGSDNAFDKFKDFLTKSFIRKPGSWQLDNKYIGFYNPDGDFDYISWHSGVYMSKDQDTSAYKEFIDFLNEIDWADHITSVCEAYSLDVITLEQLHLYHVGQAYDKLNKLQVLRDTINLYNPNDDILNEFDGAILLAKTEIATLNEYINPDNTYNWMENIAKPLFNAITKTIQGAIFKEAVKTALQKVIIFSITKCIGPTFTIGSLTGVSAATVAGYATAVLAGWDLGLTLVNWGEVSRYADISKLNMHMGHYVVDTPTFILSAHPGWNNEAMYSNIVSSLKTSIIGSGYYNMGMSRDQLWFGLAGYFNWGDDWRDAGAVCYSKSEFTDSASIVFP